MITPKNPLGIFGLVPLPYKRGPASGMAKVTEKLFSELAHIHDVKVARVTLPFVSRCLAGLSTLRSLENGLHRWQVDAALTRYVFEGKSHNAATKVNKFANEYDLLFVLYNRFSPWLSVKKQKPTCAYVDLCTPDPRNVKPWRKKMAELAFKFEDTMYKELDYIFTFSSKVRQEILELHKIDPLRVIDVGTGINLSIPDTAPPYPETANLLFVGSNFHHKGVDVLLEAFPYVREKHPHSTLTLVGYPGRFSRARLPSGVKFLGPIHDQAKLDTLFKTASMLVLPSRSEGLSHVVLESFAYARPVIATPVGSLQEWVIDGMTGYIVPVNNPKSLADRCINIISDKKKSAKMGLSGYSRVKRDGTWESVVKKMNPYLLSAVNGKIK